MADYYPLIARAIAGLDPSAPGESRRALYERARSALIAQLRSVQPPLSESEITRERLSLEEAVRKVESEAAQRARDASRPGGAGAARGGDAFRRANARPPEAGSAAAPAPRPRPASPPPTRDGDQQRPRAICGLTRHRRHRQHHVRRSCRCRNRRCRRPVNARAQRAAVPTIPRRRCRSRLACAASATSPPTPTTSAAPRRRPTARRERPMPTCPRPRRSSTGSSRAWRTAAPIRKRRIPMTS